MYFFVEKGASANIRNPSISDITRSSYSTVNNSIPLFGSNHQRIWETKYILN